MPDLGIIILAAGGSTRMGRAKQLLKVEGKTLIRKVVEMALATEASTVLVVTGNQAKAVGKEFADLPIQQVFNPDWQNGMAGSLRIGIQHVAQLAKPPKAIMVLLCDQVLIQLADLKNMYTLFENETQLAVAAGYNTIEGVPAIFDFETLRSFGEEVGDFGARYLIKRLKKEGQLAVFALPAAAMDLDTPEDYERFCKME